MLEVVLLGCGGTRPLPGRWLTSCYIRHEGAAVLIDCGEGTQVALREAGVSAQKIDLLCLTHYHADHVSGLPGLLLTMGLDGRTEPLTIVGPAGLRRVVEGLRVIAPDLPFPIFQRELLQPEEQISAAGLEIDAFAVFHGIPCYGYRLQRKRAGKFDAAKAKANAVPMSVWSTLQKQERVSHDGVCYHQSMVLGAPRKGLSVTYCTDTRPTASLAAYAQDVDLLICEGMYGEDDKCEKAIENGHMLFSEAAKLAAKAHAKQLWLTHYSPALPDPEAFLPVAQAWFSDAVCGKDGMRTILRFEEEDS